MPPWVRGPLVICCAGVVFCNLSVAVLQDFPEMCDVLQSADSWRYKDTLGMVIWNGWKDRVFVACDFEDALKFDALSLRDELPNSGHVVETAGKELNSAWIVSLIGKPTCFGINSASILFNGRCIVVDFSQCFSRLTLSQWFGVSLAGAWKPSGVSIAHTLLQLLQDRLKDRIFRPPPRLDSHRPCPVTKQQQVCTGMLPKPL